MVVVGLVQVLMLEHVPDHDPSSQHAYSTLWSAALVRRLTDSFKMVWFLWEPISELRSVTCHMGLGSHSVTWHPTQVDASRLNPSQIGWYSIHIRCRDGKLS